MPSAAILRTRWVLESATMMLPSPSTATAQGSASIAAVPGPSKKPLTPVPASVVTLPISGRSLIRPVGIAQTKACPEDPCSPMGHATGSTLANLLVAR